MIYKFIASPEEWKQVADAYTNEGITAPDPLITPTIGAFDESGSLSAFIALAPFHHAGFWGNPLESPNLLKTLDSTLENFPNSSYYTFVDPSAPPPEGMEKLDVVVYRKVF